MAEAIGLGSGIITLISLTLTVAQVSYDYVQKVQKAPRSVSQYLQEILALKTVLLKIQETLGAPNVDLDAELLPKALITECHVELDAIKQKLQYESPSRSRWSLQSRSQRLTWPFRERETLAIVERLARWNNIYTSYVAIHNLQISNAALTVAQTHQHDSQRTTILDWIYSDPSAINNGFVLNNRCENTCSWILDDPAFGAWLQGDENRKNLFCTGDPGVGKTTMMAFLVDFLVSSSSTDARILYHYFDFRGGLHSHQVVMVVRHLLRQLLEQGSQLPQELLALYHRSEKVNIELTEQVWTNTFLACMPQSHRSYVMLDGLDECPDQRGLSRFLRRLGQSKTKIYMSGRAASHQAFDLEIDHEIMLKAPPSDLVVYIESYLREDKHLSTLLTKSLSNDVVLQITNHAGGTFLLAKLALERLSGVTTVARLRKSLLSLPQDLRSAHLTTFERIQSASVDRRDLALKALTWILLARRPLTMTELLHGLAFDPQNSNLDTENIAMPMTVVQVCLGFLEHDEDSELVRFTHTTVVEYLRSECAETFKHSGLDIARTCVVYLAQSAFTLEPCQSSIELISRFGEFPLLRYIALFWGDHVFGYQTELAMDVRNLLNSRNAVLNAAQAFHFLRRARNPPSDATFGELPQGFKETHLLALWGLSDIAILQPLSYQEIVAADSLGWQPIHWAAARGHPDMIDFLLSRGAQTEPTDHRGWTPLFWAVFWGRLSTITHLLDKGANLQATDNDLNTLLHIAVDRGDPDVCSELLSRKGNWSIKILGKSAFEHGLASDTPEIATMFLARVEPKEEVLDVEDAATVETALERAVRWSPSSYGSAFRTTLSLESKAAANASWHRPLLPRLEHHRKKLRAIDLSRSTDIGSLLHNSSFAEELINQKSYEAWVLGYAILTERVEMVQALIDVGVDLKKDWTRKFQRIEYVQFPILLAAYAGNTDLIRLLVRHGASLDVADYDGRSPLHYAAILGHIDAALELSSHEQPRKSTDKNGKSPLHTVWLGLGRADSETEREMRFASSLVIADLLVQSGAGVDHADRLGNTPLHDAVQSGCLEAVQKLIQLGANTNVRAKKAQNYWTHLSSDADPVGTRKSINIMRYPHEAGFDGETPLTLACQKHEWKIASALHSAGALLPEDMDLRESLIKVVADGDLPTLKTLFSFASATQVAGSDTDQRIPLIILAVRALQWNMDESSERETDFRRSLVLPQNADGPDAPQRYRAVVEFLLFKGQDPNAGDSHGSTALLEALEYDHNKDLVDLLLAQGADDKATNNDGSGVLHAAAASGFLPFVELMLSRGADVNRVSNNAITALTEAAANGHEEVVSLLLQQPDIHASAEEVEKWHQISRCYNSIKAHNLAQFQGVVSSTLAVHHADRKGQTLLHVAAHSGIPEIVSKLIDLGADVNVLDIRGDTALHVAAKSLDSDVAVINALLDGGADIWKKNFAGTGYGIDRIPHDATALHLAAYVGREDIVRALLAPVSRKQHVLALAEHSFKTSGKKPIWETWRASDLPQATRRSDVPRFIDYTSDRCGRTALMCAVQSGSVSTAKCLLEMGADVNARGGRGSWGFCALDLTPSLWSSRRMDDGSILQTVNEHKTEMIKLLLSHGAEVFDW